MGTTQTAIRSEEGIRLAYCLAIEGYPFLICDGDPAAAVTAWASTEWAQALPGLQVSGTFKQTLAPWNNEVHVPHFKFTVQPDETDQLGKDFFKATPDVRSELTLGFGSDEDAGSGFDINVKDADLFSTGQVYIGNEAFNVTGTPSGLLIPIATGDNGYLAPFGTSTGPANSFPGPHSLPAGAVVGAYEAVSPVYVTDAPPSFIGKKVGLWVHKINGSGVLDTVEEAELWFAGTISKISDEGMATSIECDGIQQALVDATLMQDQWTGKVKEGYTFTAGSYFAVGIKGSTGGPDFAANFVCGTDFTAGRYTAAEFGSLLAEHVDADGTIGVSGSSKTLRWSSHIQAADQSARFVLTAQESSSTNAEIGILTNDRDALAFLGFTRIWGDEYAAVWSGPQIGTSLSITSEKPPYLVPPVGLANGLLTLEIEDTDGTFVDHTSSLPPDAREHVTGAEVWSYYVIDDKTLFLGRRDSDTQISGITVRTSIADITNTDLDAALHKSAKSTNGIIRQVFFVTGSFCDIITQLFTSIDGNGTNHTSDVFPFGAGIPWDLLGTSFTDSLEALEQSGVEDSIALLIEKPTRLWDAIRSDFALRMAAPVWKDGGLQIAQLTVPNASTSDFTLTEANKSDKERSRTQSTSEFLAHTIKVDINRNPTTQEFQDHFIARDKVAYENAGGSGATKTIKARNTYRGGISSGASAEALAEMITARFLPVFARELRTWRRSIPHTLFHVTPGMTCTFSDDHVRDPKTGARGVSSRPAIVLNVEHSLGISGGSYVGVVDLLYTEEDRLFPVSPSCEHATVTTTETGRNWTAGWDSSALSLLVHPNKFSDATAANDVSHFTAGDAIRITEMDPSSPAGDTFTDTIDTISQDATTGYDEIVLTTGFGGANPAFSSSKTYLVNFDDYDQCTDAQKLHAFIADTGDGQIMDLADPNLVADSVKFGSAAADLTILPSLHSAEQYGDGVPMSASFIRDQIRMCNNLTNYKTAPHTPMMGNSNLVIATADDSTYQVVWTIPYLIGWEGWHGSKVRKLNVAPFFKSGSGASTNVRVTTSANAPKGDDNSWTDTAWQGPKHQVTFNTTSTSYGVATAQEIDIVRAEGMPEFTWITVEIAGTSCGFRGIAELWLGPLQ